MYWFKKYGFITGAGEDKLAVKIWETETLTIEKKIVPRVLAPLCSQGYLLLDALQM